ncbi:EAL domain-containing protein [Chitinimonas viridis]|uniref:EAL domain-containing protein n=1 Tax=Chitinimonas viridis TaxID=664880 RepID=A0ABT8BAN9_9NEIS|nr:EAL domain-containing protein [Chitinimonas viridis]MDN3579109.1 EAL domain-containing protein [Chitinimonas viridis]
MSLLANWYNSATSDRSRFIGLVVVGYLLFSITWIFLSDSVLIAMVDQENLLSLSTTKGVFFILISAAGLVYALRAVPPLSQAGRTQEMFADSMARGALTPLHRRTWYYLLAVAMSVAMLLVRLNINADFSTRPLLIFFMLPIVISALLGGAGPGLTSTLILVLGADFLAQPYLHQSQADPLSRMQWFMLVVNGVAVSLLSTLFHHSLRKMERNKRLLNAVISGASDAIFIKEKQGRYLLVNRAAAGMVDKPISEILGRDDTEIFDEKTAVDLMRQDQVIMMGGAVVNQEEQLTTQDGRCLIFDVIKGPIFDGAGQVAGLFGISRDVTAHRRAEMALRASEAALKQAQRLAGVGNWEWDLVANSHYWSEEVFRIYGRDVTLPPATYPEIKEYFTPESWCRLESAVNKAVSQGIAYACDAEIIRPDGEHRWIIASGEAVLGQGDRVVRLWGTVQDITERTLAALKIQTSEERLQLIVDATSDGFWDWNLSTGKVFRSARYYEVVDRDPKDDAGDFAFFRQLVSPADLDAVLEAIEAHVSGETPSIEFDFRLAGHDSAPRWIRSWGRATLRDEQTGRALRVVGTVADVTERRRHEQALREAAAVFDSTHEGIMVVNPEGRIIKVNPSFQRITGYTESEVLGKSPTILSSGQHGAAFYKDMWNAVLSQSFWRGEIWNRRKSGEVYAELLSISAVKDTSGHIQYFVGVFSDISQEKQHAADLDRVAHFDALTGLPNRRLLSDRLKQSVARSARTDKASAICFIDLDGFQSVNDQFGHAVGDELLIGVANNLKAVLRADDTLARLGGDEFVLVLSELNSNEECNAILERVLKATSTPVKIEDFIITPTASIGVSLYPEDNVDTDTLLRHADQAMYLAKEAGKNRYQLFDQDRDKAAKFHRHFIMLLGEALIRQEFILYYQPKVELNTGRIVGAEALIRWQHPERGLLSPAEFLPYVEGSELEPLLGEWVISTALLQAATWADDGLKLAVSANVSADYLMMPCFFDQLQSALDRYPDLPASQFELEILETAAIGDLRQAVEVLERCKQLGVKFALDDFGTGYSSLTYLRKLPLDSLKIDQSFVRGMLEDGDDLGIVEGVIQLAGVFDRDVVAEGVETLEHATILKKMGCRVAQGYGIAKPMPAERFVAWCAEWEGRTEWHDMISAVA